MLLAQTPAESCLEQKTRQAHADGSGDERGGTTVRRFAFGTTALTDRALLLTCAQCHSSDYLDGFTLTVPLHNTWCVAVIVALVRVAAADRRLEERLVFEQHKH